VALTLSWPGFALAALLAEVAVNVAFALLYLAQPGAIANARAGSFGDAFFFSLETLATVGYGTMAPATTYGHAVSAFEIFTGMALTAVLTGLLFVRFSRPKSKILYSTHAVVAMHNGQPTLMLRIGNGRLTLLTHLNAKLGVLLADRSSEGLSYRRVHDLPLQSADIQLFVLTWTLMHTIDEASPLHGYDAGRLERDEVRLFLSVDARDQSLGAQIQEVKSYGPLDILFGQRFADAITRDASGHTTADLTLLDALEPDPAWKG
jgi:inward rectifier potassium channel